MAWAREIALFTRYGAVTNATVSNVNTALIRSALKDGDLILLNIASAFPSPETWTSMINQFLLSSRGKPFARLPVIRNMGGSGAKVIADSLDRLGAPLQRVTVALGRLGTTASVVASQLQPIITQRIA